ncbi:MAG: D-alanyl-D-alanine carboxypeptidase/D-alanyl-D-alanine-endopeptidase [Planctomycetota bacterium]|nr:D-alanyl-D-alanine carboxypeptidase/D-alanyl-D-alanine-endopeptidase [Planctomycetota bacterium]
MAPRPKKSGKARLLRLAVILAANAACVFLLWKIAFTARGAEPAEPTAPARPVVANASAANVSAATPRASTREAKELEGRVRACIQAGLRDAVATGKGRVSANQCTIAVHVREVGVGGELVSVEADRAMRPASNLKLVTSAAALVLFGADGKFETVFESASPIAAGVLQGDLVVHAGGDPLFDHEGGGDVTRFFAPVADQLKRAGITRVAGALVLDEGTFEAPAPAPGWPAKNQHWQEFCALSGGFSANAGCLTTVVESDPNGRSASVELWPRGHGLSSKLNVSTGSPRSRLDVRVGVAGGVARVEGSIPKDVSRWEDRFAAPDPVALFGNAARTALANQGVSIDGGIVRERRGPSPTSRALAKITTPIVDVLTPINTWSNNACADQLFLTMGRWQIGQGTRAGGRAATALALERLGLDTREFVQVDGSGLSRDNRISARQISGLVDAVLTGEARAAKAFRQSLAVGGETGTLDKRMSALEGRVHAKTGFIGGVSALSGYIETADGRELAFSILVEYPNVEGLNKNCWKPMEDAICEVLAAGARG